MEIGISGIGTAVPRYRHAQSDVAHFISKQLNLSPKETRRLKTIYRASGIHYRYSVLNDNFKQEGEFNFFPNKNSLEFPGTKKRMGIYREHALPLSIQAIENCFNVPEIANSYDSITHLITVSCTGMYAPGLDIELLQHFKLNTSIQRTNINFMGCYATFNALKVAHDICKSNPQAKVLVVSVELCSIHLQSMTTLNHLISGAIFSDGAGCLLIEASEKKRKALNLTGFYCDILAQSEEAMAWSISDFGFDIILSQYVSDLICSGIEEFTKRAFASYPITKNDIHYYAIHPGGANILRACEKSLKLNEKENAFSYEILQNFGNMSSATIIFVLKKIWDNLTREQQGNNIFSCAFGPGLTLESMLLKVAI